jgi:ABC-type glycerol-3-phosphate transport system permease component
MNKTGASVGIFSKTTFYIPEEDHPQMDWSNYCVIALISTICILGIIGSFLSSFSKSQSFATKIIKSFSFVDNFGKIIAVNKST